jgi:hypothetical protein
MYAVQRYLEVENEMMKNRLLPLMALFIALSTVGAAIKLPSSLGSVAFDVFPAIIASVLLGGIPGAIVGAFGHLLSAMIGGFPLGPLHLFIAVEMAVLVWIFANLYRKNKVVASLMFIFGNSIVAPLPFIFIMNMGFYLAIVPSLIVGSIINTVMALFVIPRLAPFQLIKRDVNL